MTGSRHLRIRATTLAMLLSLFLSGCTSPPTTDDSTPEIGLGLAVPAHLPEPRPFQEPPGQLQVLEDFLRDDGRRILRDCGNEGGWTQVARMLEAKKYRSAIDDLLDHCSHPLANEREWRAEKAMREGNEAEVQQVLHAQAVNATQAVADALDAHAGPGTVVEAQLLKELASLHLWGLNTIDSALLMWRPYENGREPKMNKKAKTMAAVMLFMGMALIAAPVANAAPSATASAWAACSFSVSQDTWLGKSDASADARLDGLDQGSVYASVQIESNAQRVDSGSTPWKYRAQEEDRNDWHPVGRTYTVEASAFAKAEKYNPIGPNTVAERDASVSAGCAPDEDDDLPGGGGGDGCEVPMLLLLAYTGEATDMRFSFQKGTSDGVTSLQVSCEVFKTQAL